MNVLGQHAAGEALDVEILDRNPAEAIDETAADLVQVIAPLVGNVRLILGERGLAPGAAFGARFAAGKGSLAPSQALACLLRQRRPFDRLADGECRKGGETQVDTDRRGAGRRGGRLNLDGEDHGPFAVLAGEDRGRGLAWKRAVPPHLDLAGYADDSDTAGLPQGEAIAHPELGGVIAGTGTKPGEARMLPTPCAAAEEGGERLIEPTQDLLLGTARPPRRSGNSFLISIRVRIWS
jgi:hypothetical protein